MNSLGIDLTGKTVVLKASVLKPEYRELKHRLFTVIGGFGALPHTIGGALIGTYVEDGERARVEGQDVERLWEGE